MEAAGGDPGGVWYSVPPLLRDRAARDRGPTNRNVLTRWSLHGGSQWARTTNNARTATSVTSCDGYVPSWHLTDCDEELQEQARGGVRQV